jgi:hypothetical protein
MGAPGREIAGLSQQVTALEAKFAEQAGLLAELRAITLPFLARYQQYIEPFQEELVRIQREIADLRVATGDRTAISAGESRSPLDKFYEEPDVQEQYERVWGTGGSKGGSRPTGPLRTLPASPELKKQYAEIVVHLHPLLTDNRAEKERRRQLMMKVDEAYVQRNDISLSALAGVYREQQSNLPALVDDKAVARLHDQILVLEAALAKLEASILIFATGLSPRSNQKPSESGPWKNATISKS